MISWPWFKILLFCLGVLLLPNGLNGQNTGSPELLGASINSDFNEIGPVISPDGKTLFFSRISHPQNTHGEKGSQDIWYSEWRNNQWSNAIRLPNIVNKDVYNSIYSITPDGNTILLKGSYNRGIYQTRGFSISKRIRRSWSAPETLEIPDYEKLSKGEFDCGFLSNDGLTLIMSFSSRRKGRNDDLYVSFKDKDGRWSAPQSLGPDLNTSGFMETTPFLAADGVTLYFSSDRPGGYGGNDIYSTRRLDGTWKKWSKPVNLGPAVNTSGFEGYYSVAAPGDYAYWSRNNPGETRKGDVFRLSLKKQPDPDSTPPVAPQETIAAVNVPAVPDPVVMITGKVLNNKTGAPLEAMIVFNSFPDGQEIGSATTDSETGEYKFTLPYGRVYSVRPVARDFIAATELIDLTDTTLAKQKQKDLLVEQLTEPAKDPSTTVAIADPAASNTQNAAQETGKTTRNDGPPAASTGQSKPVPATTVDTGTKDSNANTEGLIAVEQPKAGDQRVTVPQTAEAGDKNHNTGNQATKSGIEGQEKDLKTGTSGIGNDGDVSERAYQEMDKTLKAVPVEVGETIRLNNIFFETARSSLKADSRLELDQLVKILQEYPSLKVELSGHTDSEGSEATNNRLSQDRANSVRNYILQQGVSSGRITSVGYGESRPVATNETAEGRQLNRRVEFTILEK